MLQEKIKNSKYEKNTVEVVANFDGAYGDKK